jgi:hypothetical protein
MVGLLRVVLVVNTLGDAFWNSESFENAAAAAGIRNDDDAGLISETASNGASGNVPKSTKFNAGKVAFARVHYGPLRPPLPP